jgi:protein-disulfide isomerase
MDQQKQIKVLALARAGLEVTATFVFIVTCVIFAQTMLSGRPSVASAGPSGPARSGAAAPPLPTAPVSVVDAVSKGNALAPIAMIVYSDFQCPFCKRFARETLPTLVARYVDTGKLRIFFRNFPLPIHAQAERAAEASECAARFGQFWEMHDKIFDVTGPLDERAPRCAIACASTDTPSTSAFERRHRSQVHKDGGVSSRFRYRRFCRHATA